MTLPFHTDPSPEPVVRAVALVRNEMRRAAILHRKQQNPDRIAAWSRALCKRLAAEWPCPPGKIIGFCWPTQNEPDLRPLILRWRNAGASAVLPVVVAADQGLVFRPWIPASAEDPFAVGAAMVPDRYGIPTPTEGLEQIPDVLLLPLNAFDRAGYRIGYGGGFFDRTLAALTAQGQRPLVIGVGFAMSEAHTTHPQRHDEPMDWIATEQELFKP